MKKKVWKILNILRIAAPLQLLLKSGLKADGWFHSYFTKQSIDAKGNPIPWCTYAFNKFIEPRLQPHFNVFEFGSGNSTLWYAKRSNTVTAVEHDKNWYDQIISKMPKNVQLLFQELEYDKEYCIKAKTQGKKFHVIIIDGRDRNNCVINSIEALTDDVVIIFDNAQRKQYTESQDYLKEKKGFKRIDFIGITPVIANENTTTVFYRENNCLGI